MRKLLARAALAGVGLGAAALVSAGPGLVSAGQFTGNGEPTSVSGNSVCAFNGLDADGNVVNHGQNVRQYGPMGSMNAQQCNPTRKYDEPGYDGVLDD